MAVNNPTIADIKQRNKTDTGACMYLDGGCCPWSWMTTNLAAVLIGPLFVVEL